MMSLNFSEGGRYLDIAEKHYCTAEEGNNKLYLYPLCDIWGYIMVSVFVEEGYSEIQ